ncbi:MAG: response regulator transcription factor [Chitinophagaceae bacterium]|nr:MAG: response regulator transcription factor [Chitinophagaceae bacterium]
MANLLLVEDDPEMIELLRHVFTAAGHRMTCCQTGTDGAEKAADPSFNLVVLDIMLPDIDGFEVCRRIREQKNQVPILMLTSRSEEIDKVLGLEMGADDYLTKPFGLRELEARIKAILRRSGLDAGGPTPDDKDVILGEFEISRQKMKASLGGKRLDLTSKEFDLLYLLASNKGKTFSRDELLEKVWGYSFSGYEHTVTSHINRLRIKLEPDINKPYYIQTTWGKGYRFLE